jgi:hypothetical protein
MEIPHENVLACLFIAVFGLGLHGTFMQRWAMAADGWGQCNRPLSLQGFPSAARLINP